MGISELLLAPRAFGYRISIAPPDAAGPSAESTSPAVRPGSGAQACPARKNRRTGSRRIGTTARAKSHHAGSHGTHHQYASTRPSVDPMSHAATAGLVHRSEEHTSELQPLIRSSHAVFCLKKKN